MREQAPSFLTNEQETLCPERHEHNGSEVVHHLTEKLYPQGHNARQ